MDPLSISASVVALVTAAIKSTKSLCAAVERYKKRDKTLSRLQGELEDVVGVLSSLREAAALEDPILALLKGLLDRCSQVCQEFEVEMGTFHAKSGLGLRDWAKMEFMRGDINDFIDALAGYKSTINVSLGTITMRHSKMTHELLEKYDDKIQDVAYDLEIHLQRIDEKLSRIEPGGTSNSQSSVNLQDERAVTEQCLIVCQNARSSIEKLQQQEPVLQAATVQDADQTKIQFEAQRRTNQTMNDYRNSLLDTIKHLQERLSSLVSRDDPDSDRQRSRLEQDINISRQCLEVCKQASEQVSHKIYTVGEVVAEDDTDQVVLNTLSDLFDVRKAIAKNRSAQLVTSTSDETAQLLAVERYKSRFGAVNGDLARTQDNPTASFRETSENVTLGPNQKRVAVSEVTYVKPSANEVRRRALDGDN